MRTFNKEIFLFGIISSIKYLRDIGATKLAVLLMTIRISPIKTSLRLGHIMVLNALRILTFLSDIYRILCKEMKGTSYAKIMMNRSPAGLVFINKISIYG